MPGILRQGFTGNHGIVQGGEADAGARERLLACRRAVVPALVELRDEAHMEPVLLVAAFADDVETYAKEGVRDASRN
jgi:hypothetical protein